MGNRRILLKDLWATLGEETRQRALQTLSQLVARQFRPTPPDQQEVRHEDSVLTVAGRVPGISGRQAVADVAVRCLRSDHARGCVLAIADGWVRPWLQGEPFRLDVPWEPW